MKRFIEITFGIYILAVMSKRRVVHAEVAALDNVPKKQSRNLVIWIFVNEKSYHMAANESGTTGNYKSPFIAHNLIFLIRVIITNHP